MRSSARSLVVRLRRRRRKTGRKGKGEARAFRLSAYAQGSAVAPLPTSSSFLFITSHWSVRPAVQEAAAVARAMFCQTCSLQSPSAATEALEATRSFGEFPLLLSPVSVPSFVVSVPRATLRTLASARKARVRMGGENRRHRRCLRHVRPMSPPLSACLRTLPVDFIIRASSTNSSRNTSAARVVKKVNKSLPPSGQS